MATGKKSKVRAFIDQDTENRRYNNRCTVCRTAACTPAVDADIKEWIKAYKSGEAGGSTWTSFCLWLQKEYHVSHGRASLARHATRCLELPSPVNSFG